MIHDKLKKIIFNKLYKDLSHVEIIPYEDSIWFIDRENKYWYFEYQRPDILWWRFGYFNDFFTLFSLEREEFQWIISEWVEEVLNCKVNTPMKGGVYINGEVEEVLNCKVNTPATVLIEKSIKVEEVLNCKVNTPYQQLHVHSELVEEVLNCKVTKPNFASTNLLNLVDNVLDCSVNKSFPLGVDAFKKVEDVLNVNK